MAIVTPGRVGRFNGKIGDVVVAKYRDLIVGRSVPSKSTKPPTKKQLDQQMKFKVVNSFFGKMAKVTSKRYLSNGSLGGLNAAVRDHIETALTGIYPNYQLDYTKVMLTKGNGELLAVSNPTLNALVGAQVEVSWEMRIKPGQVLDLVDPKDRVSIILHNVTKGKNILYFDTAERNALTYTADLPWSFVGDQVHAYLFFTSVDEQHVSDSEYVGSFTVMD